MKKTEVEAILCANKSKRTTSLVKIIKGLQEIVDERELTRSMHFWSPSKTASGRRYNERRRNFGLHVEMKDLNVHYWRDYSESCKYVYASDRLCSDQYENFNTADAKKIIDGLKRIIKEREKKMVVKSTFVTKLTDDNFLDYALRNAESHVQMYKDKATTQGMDFNGLIHTQMLNGLKLEILRYCPDSSDWERYLYCVEIYDLLCERHPEWKKPRITFIKEDKNHD